MPNLNNYSVTGSYLSSQPYYRHEGFSIDSKEFDLHMFVGDASLDETAEPISPNVFKELSENIDFITLMIKLSTAWNANFKREIAKWPARYSEASKKLSLAMIEHLSKEMKKIKFTD